jgi:hypothetical protein
LRTSTTCCAVHRLSTCSCSRVPRERSDEKWELSFLEILSRLDA